MKTDLFFNIPRNLDLELQVLLKEHEELNPDPASNRIILSLVEGRVQKLRFRPAIGPKEVPGYVDEYLKNKDKYENNGKKYNPYQLWVLEKVSTETGATENVKVL